LLSRLYKTSDESEDLSQNKLAVDKKKPPVRGNPFEKLSSGLDIILT
jgi:hypothetical protein